jgi:ribosomal protein L14E/L6E/L27E
VSGLRAKRCQWKVLAKMEETAKGKMKRLKEETAKENMERQKEEEKAKQATLLKKRTFRKCNSCSRIAA